MRESGNAPQCLDTYRAAAVYLPLHKIVVTLTLGFFFGCTFIIPADAQVSKLINQLTGIFSAERTSPEDPYLLDLSGVTRPNDRARVDHPGCKTAEQLYEAASGDARTLEGAIFLSALRQEVERALGKRVTDDELRALADQAREEAHRWYKYIQADQGCAMQ